MKGALIAASGTLLLLAACKTRNEGSSTKELGDSDENAEAIGGPIGEGTPAPTEGSPEALPEAEAEEDATTAANGKWGPISQLKDVTNTFPGTHDAPRPDDGWWVTPIHATLLADGKVVITGWERIKAKFCPDHRGRQNGVSFVLDPSSLDTGGAAQLNVQPIDEKPKPNASGYSADVLYCSGHAPFADGRILFTGGARYRNLDVSSGPNKQDEYGINYSRVFDPASKTFTRVKEPNPGGPAAGTWPWYEQGMTWYPTNTRLPGHRIMVTGGYAKWVDLFDPNKFSYLNKSIVAFDAKAIDAGENPWKVMVPTQNSWDEVAIDVFDYGKAFLLPKPVTVDGMQRQVALYGGGKNNKIAFLNVDQNTPNDKRLAVKPNSGRPNNGRLNESTAALTATGEIMVMGGGSSGKNDGQRIDLYDPVNDKWSSTDTKITRYKSSSTLLPDGTVLLINGEDINSNDTIGDRRQTQIFNPKTKSVKTLSSWTGDAKIRGYHNLSLLLKDGRVLVGGGRTLDRENDVEEYRIGCERPELRIFSPPYLFNGDRPVVQNFAEPREMKAGGPTVEVEFSGPAPRAGGGVVLMALGSITHGFDQNQRIIPLTFNNTGGGKVSVTPPANTQAAPEGLYILFLISDAGVPSVGKTVRIKG